jgi:hypothetical protein
MANTLRFKRGLASGIPTAAAGEPLFTTDTFDLYIGNGTGNTRFQKYIASGATTQILRGDGSLYTFPLAISSPSAGQVLKYNGTSWVNDSDSGITGSGSAGQVAYFTGATTQAGSNNLFWDATNSRLGIGTNAPVGKIEIAGTSNLRFFSATDTTADVSMGFISANSRNTAIDELAKIDFRKGSIYYSGEIAFSTANDMTLGALTEAMRINRLQRVLIGSTTDSGEKLQVTGTMKVTGATSIDGTTFNVDATNNRVGIGTANPLVQLDVNGAINLASGFSLTWGGAYGANIPTIASVSGAGSYMAFYPAGSTSGERMRLDASGNLGLGVTPSAWGSILRAQQIGNYGAFIAGRTDSVNQVFIGVNAYYNGTNWIYSNTSSASRYYQESGGHYWDQAPSGTAGNAITFTQAMTLTAAGRLLIGSTSEGTETLQVTGTAKITGITTFGSQVHVPNSSNGTLAGYYFDYNTSQANSRTWRLVNDYASYGDFQLQQSTTQTGSTFATILNFSPSGAATFSSSVTAASGIFTGNLTVDTSTFVVDAANNRVGIGTASPTETLDVRGITYFRGTYLGVTVVPSAFGADMYFYEANNPKIYLQSAGTTVFNTGYNFLIGSGTDSGERLQVTGTAKITGATSFGSTISAAAFIPSYNTSYYITDGAISNYSATNYMYVNGTGGLRLKAEGIGYQKIVLEGGTSNDIWFTTANTERLRITSGGNVAIDTNTLFVDATNNRVGILNTTPSEPLHVAGNMLISGANSFKMRNLAGTDVNVIRAVSGGVNTLSTATLGNNIAMGTQSAHDFILCSSDTERIRLSSQGWFSHATATNPSSSVTDSYVQYSADVVAGNAAPHFRTENGAVIKLYQETTAVGNAIISLGGGSAVLDDTEFDGYTLRQLVRALRNQGILQ